MNSYVTPLGDRRALSLVPENQDNLVLNVDREAAEHGARIRRQWSKRGEHEPMRNNVASLADKQFVVQ
jgi:hypothetical protein